MRNVNGQTKSDTQLYYIYYSSKVCEVCAEDIWKRIEKNRKEDDD